MSAQSPWQAVSSLVDEGVLTPAQARAVLSRVGVAPDVESPNRRPDRGAVVLRQRLVEAAVYLGIAFVVAAVAIVISQQWRELSQTQRVVLTGALTVVALLAGLVLGGGGAARPDAGAHDRGGIRRRSASALLTAAAALAAATVFVVVGDGAATGPACFGTALAVLLVAHRRSPSLLTEIALFAGTAGLAGTGVSWLMPEPPAEATAQDWQRYRYVVGFVMVATGVLWAWVVARGLRVTQVAVSLGMGLTLLAGVGLSDGPQGHLVADLTLTVVGVAALITYVHTPAWPWIVGSVVSATLVVFSVAGGAFGPALAFLFAGLVLLGGVGVLAVVRRRRPQEMSGGSEPVGSGRPEQAR